MFRGFPGISRRKRQQEPKKANICFYCRREKGEREFYFFSDTALREAQLEATIDVICSSEKDGSSMLEVAEQVYGICIPRSNKGFVGIDGNNNGRIWIITINRA